MVTVTWAGTGLPSCLAGAYRYCLRARIAASRKEAGPESTFIDFTCPEESTKALRVTIAVLLLSKYGKAFGEATARTDLISLGGMKAGPSEIGVAEASARLLDERGTGRFATAGVIVDFCSIAGASLAVSLGAGGGRTSKAEGFTASTGADCGALGGDAGAPTVCVGLAEPACASAVL